MSKIEVELPAHLSYSQASNLQKCSWQYALGRLLRAPEEPSWAATGGSAVHAATEEWDLETLKDNWITDPKVLEEFWIKAFDEAIDKALQYTEYPVEQWRASGRASKQWPNKEDRAWWDDNGPGMVKSWVNWRMNNPAWELAWLPDPETGEAVAGIEVPGNVILAGLPVKFYIDRVLSNQDGQLLIVDLKSGREPDDATQLGTYHVGLRQQYDVTSTWGTYWMARTGMTTTFEDMRMWPDVRVEYTYEVARKTQEEGLLIAKRSSMCSGCSVRDSCYAYNGKNSDNFPLPWEVKVKPRALSS